MVVVSCIFTSLICINISYYYARFLLLLLLFRCSSSFLLLLFCCSTITSQQHWGFNGNFARSVVLQVNFEKAHRTTQSIHCALWNIYTFIHTHIPIHGRQWAISNGYQQKTANHHLNINDTEHTSSSCCSYLLLIINTGSICRWGSHALYERCTNQTLPIILYSVHTKWLGYI